MDVGQLDLELVVLGVGALLLAGLAAIKTSHRLGTPVLLLFVGLGVLIGEGGLGVAFDDAQLTAQAGTLFLAVILWDGGFTTSLSEIRPVAAPAAVLATVGVLASIAVTSVLVWLVLDVDVRTALILGAVASSTDAAATFAVLRNLPILRRIRTTLEAESGMNDPPVIVLVSVIVSDAWGKTSPLAMLGMAAYQLVVGALAGIAIAWLGVRLLGVSALPASGLYPLGTVAIGMIAFAGAGQLSASGLLAAYVAGVVVGNAKLPHVRTTQGFCESLAWLAQIGLFTMLGLLASPSRLPEAVLTAVIVGAALTFVARPMSVAVCLVPFRVSLREQVFIAWGGLRGAVPIVLASLTMSAGVPGATHIFDVVFLLVIIFTLIQGPTLPLVARATGVRERTPLTQVTFESAPLEKVDMTVVQLSIPRGSRLHGVAISELRLPHPVAMPMVIREGQVVVPGRWTVLRAGDDLVLTTPPDLVPRVERRLRDVDRWGRLARWHRPDAQHHSG